MQCIGNGLVHIPVAVCAQTSPQNQTGRLSGLCGIAGVQRGVAFVIDRVTGFFSPAPCRGVFPADDGFSPIERGCSFRVVMLEFMDAGPGDIRIGIIHDGCSLKIPDIMCFPLKAERAPFQFPVLIAEQFIRHTGINDRGVRGDFASDARVVAVQANGDVRVRQHVFEQSEVSVPGDALPGVVEIIHIVAGAERQPADNGRWQFFGIALPLFAGIVPDEGLIQRPSDERNSLFFKIGGLFNAIARNLGGKKGFCPGRREVFAVKGIDGEQVDGHGIDFAAMCDEHLVPVGGELAEPGKIFPYLRYGSMKDM